MSEFCLKKKNLLQVSENKLIEKKNSLWMDSIWKKNLPW